MRGRPRRFAISFLCSKAFFDASRFGSRCRSPTNNTKQLRAALAAYNSRSCKIFVSDEPPIPFLLFNNQFLSKIKICVSLIHTKFLCFFFFFFAFSFPFLYLSLKRGARVVKQEKRKRIWNAWGWGWRKTRKNGFLGLISYRLSSFLGWAHLLVDPGPPTSLKGYEGNKIWTNLLSILEPIYFFSTYFHTFWVCH